MDNKVESLKEISITSGVSQYVTHCPNCRSLGKRCDDYKLSISIEKNVFHCYRCNWSGKVDQLLKGYIDGGSLLRYKLNNLDLRKKFENKSNVLIQTELIDFDNISLPIDNSFINAVSYLKKRNITFDEIEKYKIRIGKGKYRGRIIIPTFDVNNNVVYIVARDYVNNEPEAKYINPSGSHKSFAVWNIQNVKKEDTVIITEGVFSGIAANRNTPEKVVAVSVFGKVLSEQQAKQISLREPREISLCFDGDVKKEEVINNYSTLRNYFKKDVSIIKLIENEDPDSIDGEEFRKRYENRKLYNRVLLKTDEIFNKIKKSW